MKNIFLTILFFFCLLPVLHSQEGGVSSFNIPVRNSLKYNKFILNPAFSFAREQNSYVSIFNKREWVQFDNAPQTYLVSYSGRFRENQGVSVGLFQQNYGVLTTFGGIANFAQNVYLSRDSNLTFGVNLGFYKSGINLGNVVTNFADPSLELIPSNTLITLSPGINYGNAFFDFGLAVNNAVLYNVQSSQLVPDDPQRSIQAHLMYTGFIDSNGFFDRSKFSGLVRAESKKEQTVISGLMMLTIPKGIWAQAGYNIFHGISAGLGLNLTSKIAVEYNYERAIGSFTQLGPSHEIVLAYKFVGKYNDDEEDEGSIIPAIESRKTDTKKTANAVTTVDPSIQKDKELRDAKAKALLAENRLKREKLFADAAAKAKATADANEQIKLDNEAKAKALLAENRLKREKFLADAAAKAKIAADLKLKPVVPQQQKAIPDEAKIKADAVAKAKLAADAKAKADAAAKAKADADSAKLIADAKAKADADAAKLAADAKAKADADAAKLAADAKAKANADAAKLAADARAKADVDAAKLAADAIAKADADAAKLIADAKAKADADAAKLIADAKAKADADAAKLAADAKAKADADAAKLAADAKAKANADAAKLAADARAKADVDAAKSAADAIAKADADAAKLIADARVKADADAAKLAADAKAKADADAAKLIADARVKDDNAKSMDNIALSLAAAREIQQQLLSQLNEKVAQKDKELKDLKNENDLNDRGIASPPKEFKSVSAENAALESLKSEIDLTNKKQNQLLSSINTLYEERLKKTANKNDALTLSYLKTINELKANQKIAEQSNSRLITALVQINEATEIEKKRRIKRANFENEDSRYKTDQETLNRIIATTAVSTIKPKAEDFDYGKELANMQIIKNIKNVETGYYIVLAVHQEVSKRDTFVTKTVAAGEQNINFFYDVKSTNYFIYVDKFDNLTQATQILESRGSKTYNGKMTIIRVEN